MLFIENQNRDHLYTIGANCRIKLDKGNSVHRIYITFPAITGSEELARYSSYDKAKQAYRDLIRYLTMNEQFRPCVFIMSEDKE